MVLKLAYNYWMDPTSFLLPFFLFKMDVRSYIPELVEGSLEALNLGSFFKDYQS